MFRWYFALFLVIFTYVLKFCLHFLSHTDHMPCPFHLLQTTHPVSHADFMPCPFHLSYRPPIPSLMQTSCPAHSICHRNHIPCPFHLIQTTLPAHSILLCFIYEVCPKCKCTDFLFKCLLGSPEITSYLLQSMTLGKLHSGSKVFSTDHSSTRSHFL